MFPQESCLYIVRKPCVMSTSHCCNLSLKDKVFTPPAFKLAISFSENQKCEDL